MKEIFKDIPGYEGLYKISNYGNIYTYPRERVKGGLLKTFSNINTNYVHCRLYKNGKGKTVCIHRLVAELFLEKVKGANYVDHIDHNRTNNRFDNIRWCTQKENCRYWNVRKVGQFDKQGNLLREFQTLTDAQDYIGSTHVADVCRGNRKTAKGYIWKYID